MDINTGAIAFSSLAEDSINQKIEIDHVEKDNLLQFYEIDRCIQWITSNGYAQVALQFPDDLLCDAFAVSSYLKHCVNVCVIGDTAYGSCCVDFSAAKHLENSALIHFGHSCLTRQESKLPVLYIYGAFSLDMQSFTDILQTNLSISVIDRVIVLLDSEYVYLSADLRLHLSKLPCEVIVPDIDDLNITEVLDSNSQVLCCHVFERSLLSTLDPASTHIVYVGRMESAFTNLSFAFSGYNLHAFDPLRSLWNPWNVGSKMFMRRMFLVEKARDVSTFGIVIGTLAAGNYKQILMRLKRLLKSAGVRYYVLVMGKLNPAKLSNLANIDMYVLIACPEHSLLSSKDFFKPVVTPLEIELAFNPHAKKRLWDSSLYSCDYSCILSDSYLGIPEIGDDLDLQYDVSLISGSVRKMGITQDDKEGKQVVCRNESRDIAEVMRADGTRHFWGLEEKLGEHSVKKAGQGAHGIASCYSGEGV